MIGDVIDAFLAAAEAENRAPKTLSKYRFKTAEIQSLAEDRRVSHITQLNPQFADAYRSQLRKADKAPKTIYNSLVILRSLTLFAHRRRLSDVDPLVGYKLRKPKPTPQPCWSSAEADTIVAAAPATYRSYFQFLRETGCRAGEGKFLTWNDVDFARSIIHIRPKDNWKPKSGDQRTVPMTERLAGVLKALPRQGRWVFTAPATAKHPSADRQISERRSLQALKPVLKKVELEGHLHTFRHTYISQALMRGVPEPVVRQWVGHVDPAIIRLYTHVSDEVSQTYIRRFSGDDPR
ncbi:MAG: site-specific integrase [Planctomycetaceae bacterium]|nr:site-specific integrase [Planctomycetaceae bacterium]